MTARIEWSPDGRQLLAHVPGVRTGTCDLDGSEGWSLVEKTTPYLDARWNGESIATLQRTGLLLIEHDVTVEVTRPLLELGRMHDRVMSMALGGYGHAIALATAGEVRVDAWNTRPRRHWFANQLDLPRGAALGLALSDDGGRVAVTFETSLGAGWVVAAVADGRVLARDWYDSAVGLRVVFGPGGERLAYVVNDGDTLVGVSAIDGEVVAGYPEYLARGSCVSLGAGGDVAAFGESWPPRVRFDYVDAGDSLALDVALPDLAAIAISPDARWVACLASDASVEVVPVP